MINDLWFSIQNVCAFEAIYRIRVSISTYVKHLNYIATLYILHYITLQSWAT